MSFVLRSKGTLERNSSSSVFNRTSPSLLHIFLVDTQLNFPMPFNIILTYTNTSRVKAFRHHLVSHERWSSAGMKIKTAGNLFTASIRECGWRKENIAGL